MLRKILAFFRKKEKGPDTQDTAAYTGPEPPEEMEPPGEEMLSAPMVPEPLGSGAWVCYDGGSCSGERIRWVSREKDADGKPVLIRGPLEHTKSFPFPGPFVAAGKRYRDLNQLTVHSSGDNRRFKDKYGRRVFSVSERFPCFDSYDYLYENRYFRWFFILENGTLTRVRYTDGQNQLQVTEDVCCIEYKCWNGMADCNFWEWEGENP